MNNQDKHSISYRNKQSKQSKSLLVKCTAVGLLFFWITGCALSPEYQRPVVPTPLDWRVDLASARGLADTAWWALFQDPKINALIQTALNENKDLLKATARIEQAFARVQAANADYFPQLSYGGSVSRRKESEERIFPFGKAVDPMHTIFHGFIGANWELDLWGRVRRATEAARAEMIASKEGRQAVIMTLVCAVTSSYVRLLTLDKQLKIARDEIETRGQWGHLFETKKEGGQVSDLEMSQVNSLYEAAETKIPALERRIAILENALAVLLGRDPGPIERNDSLDNLVMPEIPAGLASDLLTRRPDIRQSEQELIAANARIGEARARCFPSISLTGLFGYASGAISDFLSHSANTWEVGASLVGPIFFKGGSLSAEIKLKEAVYKELLYNYLGTIQTAFREVNDALVSIQKLRELQQAQDKLVKTSEGYVGYARDGYTAGYTNYLSVMDAEEKYFEYRTRQAASQGDLFIALVDIYKAMGGGWVTEADKLAKNSAPQR
jgi:outer membrane protein, multidrug efflux system